MTEFSGAIDNVIGLPKQQALSQAVTSIDDDPEQASRAIKLGDASGADPTTVFADVDGFDRQFKGSLTSQIVKNNHHLQDYINSHPLAAKVSNDDWSQLDTVSEHLKPFGNLTASGTLKNFAHGFEEGEGPGGIGEWLRSQPGGKEFAQSYPYSAAAWYALGAPIEIPLRLTSALMHGGAEAVAGWIEGATGVEKDIAKSAMLSVADIYFMGRMSGNIHPAPGVAPIKAHNESLKQAATKAFTEHLDEVEGLIKPYIDSGEPTPSGLHPAIDKVLIEQAKLDAKAADDAFSESQKAATRERSPELFQNFIRQHTEAKIGISADAIRELYGDKEPTPSDNILGWVPNIVDRLRTAEATGGHVEIPWAETLARMDPEIWKELHDDMQFRPGGVTRNEGKELEKGPQGVPLTLEGGIRSQAGISPVFAEGAIQNLRLKKIPQQNEFGSTVSHNFKISDEKGRDVGEVLLTEKDKGKTVYVEWVQSSQAQPNEFTRGSVRSLGRQLREEFPNAEFIDGERVSGARDKSGKAGEMVRIPLKAFRDEHLDSFIDMLKEGTGQWEDFGKTARALIPTEEWTKNEQQIIDKVQDVLDRIVPNKVDYQPAREIRLGKREVRGLHLQFKEDLPIIVWSLRSDDPIGTAKHEALHQLRQYGFFSKDEWAILKDAAIDGDWFEKHQIDQRYPGQSFNVRTEEAIAEEFAKWDREPKSDHPAAKLFQKLKDLLDQIKMAIKDALGFEPTWQDLFKKAEEGEIGRREGTEPLDPEAFRAQEKEPELPGMTRQEDLGLFKPNSLGIDAKHYNKMMKTIEKLNTEAELHQMERAVKEEKKRQTKEWKENEVSVRDQVKVDIEQRPDISAARFFGEGMLYGEKLDKRPKLDEAKLTPEQKAGLRESSFSEHGIDPDDVAGLFGYQSGDLLVDAMIRQKEDRGDLSLNKFIEAEVEKETQKRMEKQFGKLDENVLQEAREKVLSPTQMDLLHEETVAAGMRIGSEMPFTKQDAAAWVKESFKGLQANEVSARKFLEQSGRLGRQIEKAHIDGDLTLAFQLMQKREFAALMAKEAIKFEKEKAQFERTAKRSEKQVISGVEQEYTNFVHDILMRVGRPPKRSIQNLAEDIQQKGYKDLETFVNAKEVETFGLDEIPVADFLFNQNFRKSIDEMTTDEFRGTKQSVDTLLKHGRDVKKIIVAGEAADLAEIKAEMVEKLETFPEKEYPATKGRVEKILDLPKSWLANSINMETLLNRWDRNDPRGVFNKYLVRPLTEAANYKAKLDRKYSKPYQALGKIENQTKLMESPFIDPLSGKKFSGFTKGNTMAILQNAGNISNWKTLTKGYDVDPGMLKQWLFDNTTKKDWDRAQAMGDIFGDIFAEAEQVYRNVTGVAPEKVELQPIETPFGTYQGWYHPLIKDPIREGKSKAQRGGDVYDNSDYGHATVANGYTKRRTGAVYPLDLNFDMVPARMSQMLHDIAFRQVVIETQKVFSDKEFRDTVTKHYGDQYKDGLMDYLRGVAGNASVNSKAAAKAMQLSEFLRQNVISTYIGFNPYTALKHGPTALALSAKEVGAGNFARAVASLYGRSEDISLSNSEFAMKNSEELQRRERHWQDTIVGQHKDLYGKSTLRESIIEKGSWLVAQSDMMSAKPTWLAQYWKSVEEGADRGQAVFEADRAVRRAHGSTAITNQPALVRGGGAMHGWLTSIYGFFGTMMQRRVELAHQMADTYNLGREGELKQAAGNVPAIAAGVFAYVIWPTIVEEWVTGLTTDDKRGWGEHVLTASMAGLASSMLYIRDIVHGLTTGQEPSVGLLTSPLHDLKRLTDDLKQGKRMFDKQHAGRMVGDTITVFGELTGMAPKAIGNAAKFGIDLASGKERPKTITDWRMGITRGSAKKRVEK